jgi:hypothetical protein
MKKLLLLSGVISLILIITFKCLANSKSQGLLVKSDNETWEHKLAAINAGSSVSNEDLTVTRFREILDNIAANFSKDNKQGIANALVGTKYLLDNEGISESLLDVAESLNGITVPDNAELKFKQIGVAYAALRAKGKNSKEAVLGLEALFSSFGSK